MFRYGLFLKKCVFLRFGAHIFPEEWTEIREGLALGVVANRLLIDSYVAGRRAATLLEAFGAPDLRRQLELSLNPRVLADMLKSIGVQFWIWFFCCYFCTGLALAYMREVKIAGRGGGNLYKAFWVYTRSALVPTEYPSQLLLYRTRLYRNSHIPDREFQSRTETAHSMFCTVRLFGYTGFLIYRTLNLSLNPSPV